MTSSAVIEELSKGKTEERSLRLELARQIQLVPIDHKVIEIASVYIREKIMPADPTGDALHLAIASHHRCDFLVTWNCRHLANANKFGHIARVSQRRGLHVPTLVTPLELLGDTDETHPG